jgi:hypothetical protein
MTPQTDPLRVALGSRLDLGTRLIWRTVGRPIDPASNHRWLHSPHNERGSVGDDWLDALQAAGRVRAASPDDGLLETMSALDGPEFSAADVDPQVRHFYEHTASWRMEVWSQWNAVFAPAGELIARLWGRRVEQLALPVQPLAVSRGMSSAVRVVEDEHGRRYGAAWLRALRSDGSKVYSGFYRVDRPPMSAQPHVKVAFPLENGSVQVYLTPHNDADGSFWLHSRSARFGADGAYSVVHVGGKWHAAQVPLRETFHVFTDDEGLLRTDHWLKIGRWQALRLHYRLERTSSGDYHEMLVH